MMLIIADAADAAADNVRRSINRVHGDMTLDRCGRRLIAYYTVIRRLTLVNEYLMLPTQPRAPADCDVITVPTASHHATPCAF